jgi:hypothetical protein
MRTQLSVFLVLGLVVSHAEGQVRIGPRGPEPTPESKMVDRDVPQRAKIIVGRNAAEPQPPLKHSLYPTLRERTPGNSVPYWYRALLPVIRASGNGSYKPFYDNMDSWLSGPIAAMPLADIKPFLERHLLNGVYQDARRASLRETTDWDWRLDQLSGTEAVEFRLEEAQEARGLARLLIMKARVEIAERRFEDALETLEVCYRLSEDVGRNDLIIAQLVGMAISSMADTTVLELIRSPDSPNLYWALAARPRPLFDVRRSAEFDVTLPERMAPRVMQARANPHSSAEWEQIFREELQTLARVDGSTDGWPAQEAPQSQWDLFVTNLALVTYPQAKRDLIDAGRNADEIATMPVGQVLAEHQAQDLEFVRQETLKWMLLPPNEGRERAREEFEELTDEGRLNHVPWRSRTILPLAGALMPSVTQFGEASERRERYLNMLMALEAVRMQIAHDGRVPASLADVDVVPVPKDRYTDAPFAYTVEQDRAILELRLHVNDLRSLDWEIELVAEPRK